MQTSSCPGKPVGREGVEVEVVPAAGVQAGKVQAMEPAERRNCDVSVRPHPWPPQSEPVLEEVIARA